MMVDLSPRRHHPPIASAQRARQALTSASWGYPKIKANAVHHKCTYDPKGQGKDGGSNGRQKMMMLLRREARLIC
jgi:hypothetical protein